MNSLPGVGKLLIGFGLVLIGLGGLLVFAGRFEGLKFLGRLPGDFNFRGENWQVHFPLATSLILSLVLSAVLWLISYFFGGGRPT